jgi:carbon storage regulator
MLVLTRRVGEEIVIAGNIRVTVLALCGKRVRLGIAASSFVRVVRAESLPGNVGRHSSEKVSGMMTERDA